jgi:Leucine-rich repeat (LRR) protein
MLRAIRLNPYNINKIAQIFIWCEDNNICLNNLQMLKNNDVNFNKKIRIYDGNYGIHIKKESLDIKLLEKVNNEFPGTLKRLDLSNNCLEIFPDLNLPNLKTLNVSRNKLTEIGDFSGCPKLGTYCHQAVCHSCTR